MKALILVDLQNDFLPGGALAVNEGDQVIAVANKLMQHKGKLFDLVVATQDWHPAHHGSFARNQGKKVGEMGKLAGLDQVMWPDHCVQGSLGAEFSNQLMQTDLDKVVQKGLDPEVDSYSGFFDNGRRRETELQSYLRGNQVQFVFVMGLALDYCVKYTALDSAELGFRTTLILDGCRAVNLRPGDGELAVTAMRKAGVEIKTATELMRA